MTEITSAMYHILLVLMPGEMHGYGIMQEIEALPHGQLRIGPGTLYRSIKAMLEEGWIEESNDRPNPTLNDARRRYYRLTHQGRLVLLDETARLEQLVAVAQLRLKEVR